MPQSLNSIYIHVVFSTKNRKPLIDNRISSELFNYLGGICKVTGANPIQIGGYIDHVHILCRLSKNVTLPKFIEELKKRSSKWIKTKGQQYSDFYWQDGYCAISVRPDEVEKLIRYIKNQRDHHDKRQYKDELVAFLNKFNIVHDEKYLWE
ncbi:IS200/IS605 family transposase [Rhodohalobacter mucosus]|uniref:IS200/IS605 family transposase n=1 Tax=Rhodohalobacter mucosus TaxID=2079485 RepID=A0A316U2R8_9BACT|nr:IS200/IS605 family transposase [Rhodohalobacter mucosus]PWN07616.1 IS200/IS605 family transposase [Rhodohalobacter mucosus]